MKVQHSTAVSFGKLRFSKNSEVRELLYQQTPEVISAIERVGKEMESVKFFDILIKKPNHKGKNLVWVLSSKPNEKIDSLNPNAMLRETFSGREFASNMGITNVEKFHGHQENVYSIQTKTGYLSHDLFELEFAGRVAKHMEDGANEKLKSKKNIEHKQLSLKERVEALINKYFD